MCLSKWHFSVNSLSQLSHEYGLSTCCDLTWWLKLEIRTKVLLHCLQDTLFEVCDLACQDNADFSPNVLPHLAHMCGFSPLCSSLKCQYKSYLWLNISSQSQWLQLNTIPLLCFRLTCRCKLLLWWNALLQGWQGNINSSLPLCNSTCTSRSEDLSLKPLSPPSCNSTWSKNLSSSPSCNSTFWSKDLSLNPFSPPPCNSTHWSKEDLSSKPLSPSPPCWLKESLSPHPPLTCWSRENLSSKLLSHSPHLNCSIGWILTSRCPCQKLCPQYLALKEWWEQHFERLQDLSACLDSRVISHVKRVFLNLWKVCGTNCVNAGSFPSET